MRQSSVRLCAAFAGLLVVLLLAPAAFAHGILLSSTPAAHGSVSADGFKAELHFNVRVDGSRSKLTLTTRKDPSKVFPLSAIKQASADTLTATSPAITRGEYALHWIVLSSDGHITQGEIIFTAK